MAQAQQQTDPWAEAAKNYKPQAGGEVAPASGGNDDWKIWQDQGAKPEPGMLEPHGGVMDLLRGAGAGLKQLVTHPIDTLAGGMQGAMAAGMSPMGEGYPSTAATGRPQDSAANKETQMTAQEGQREQGQFIKEHPAFAAGEFAGPAAATMAVGEGVPMLHEMALGDPNVAALKGLRVGPGSAKSLSTVRSVEGARPFLQGAESLEDLQGRIPGAKAEIWGPYQQTVDSISGKQVMGPDGPTTVGQLEQERQQISANLRALKSGGPEAIQLAAQKGMSQAELLARENAVQAALDPHLEQAGIDPKLIRQTFGQVAQVGGRVAGKSTLAEPQQPYGFGRMMNMSLAEPRSWFGEPARGARDLFAGRPLWSGKPTDINLREAFRTGGAKPDFRSQMSAMPRYEQPPKQLEANVPGNAGYGDIDVGSMSGLPHPAPQITPIPTRHLQLPEITTPGEVQPMARYAKPYAEPFDPHFRPVDLNEYRTMFPRKGQ